MSYVFFEKLADALRASRGSDKIVIDGPEDNYAVVDQETAAEINDAEVGTVIGYGFWSIPEAEKFDRENEEKAYNQNHGADCTCILCAERRVI